MPQSIYKVIELIGTSNKSWEEADVVGVDPARVQDRELRVAEVVADGPDHVRVREERGRQREVDGGAAEQLVALAGVRLDGVERDGPDDGDLGHGAGR